MVKMNNTPTERYFGYNINKNLKKTIRKRQIYDLLDLSSVQNSLYSEIGNGNNPYVNANIEEETNQIDLSNDDKQRQVASIYSEGSFPSSNPTIYDNGNLALSELGDLTPIDGAPTGATTPLSDTAIAGCLMDYMCALVLAIVVGIAGTAALALPILSPVLLVGRKKRDLDVVLIPPINSTNVINLYMKYLENKTIELIQNVPLSNNSSDNRRKLFLNKAFLNIEKFLDDNRNELLRKTLNEIDYSKHKSNTSLFLSNYGTQTKLVSRGDYNTNHGGIVINLVPETFFNHMIETNNNTIFGYHKLFKENYNNIHKKDVIQYKNKNRKYSPSLKLLKVNNLLKIEPISNVAINQLPVQLQNIFVRNNQSQDKQTSSRLNKLDLEQKNGSMNKPGLSTHFNQLSFDNNIGYFLNKFENGNKSVNISNKLKTDVHVNIKSFYESICSVARSDKIKCNKIIDFIKNKCYYFEKECIINCKAFK